MKTPKPVKFTCDKCGPNLALKVDPARWDCAGCGGRVCCRLGTGAVEIVLGMSTATGIKLAERKNLITVVKDRP